jgi:hypothetical protein
MREASSSRDLWRIEENKCFSAVIQHVYCFIDSIPRALRVLKDGVPVEEYAYDENGTRIFEMNSLRGIVNREGVQITV